MSLIRQLWLAVVLVMALAFGGTFLISTAAARHYLTQQLYVKNVDNATALALSMSQMEKDPVTIELLLSAQFDAGHYRLIRLTDPSGALLVERRDDTPIEGVPAAFVAAISLEIGEGVAQVQDGWKQYGTLTIESHDQYAYAELWSGTLRLLGWFTGAALVVGVIGSMLMRLILRPLKNVVDQAEAIGARRFVTSTEPSTLEFRQLVRSMNTLSGRVQQMLEDESQRVEQLRRRAQIDPISGLRNRETFLAAFEDALESEDLGASGVLVILRVTGLVELNRSIGREAVDQILRRIGDQLSQAIGAQSGPWQVGRLNSADFVAMAPGETDPMAVATALCSQAELALERPDAEEPTTLRTGCTAYHRGETRAAVLARVDGALAQAEQTGAALIRAEEPQGQADLPTDLASWRAYIEQAIDRDGVQLGRFPVVSAAGKVLHYEAPMRLKLGAEWQPAARFIVWAARLGLMPRLDRLVLEAALRQVAQGRSAISVNVSPETLCDPTFPAFVMQRLRSAPELAALLWLEVPEYGALKHLREFRSFCGALKPLGCRLGLKQAGQHFSRIAELHDLGLDYLKIDGAMVQGVHEGAGHQMFVRSLCTVAHTIGLTTIASNVSESDDMSVLAELGMDGFTGPAVREPGSGGG